jgi:hypothetical protein
MPEWRDGAEAVLDYTKVYLAYSQLKLKAECIEFGLTDKGNKDKLVTSLMQLHVDYWNGQSERAPPFAYGGIRSRLQADLDDENDRNYSEGEGDSDGGSSDSEASDGEDAPRMGAPPTRTTSVSPSSPLLPMELLPYVHICTHSLNFFIYSLTKISQGIEPVCWVWCWAWRAGHGY